MTSAPPEAGDRDVLLRRALRFAMTGGLTTAVAYAAMMLLLKVMSYAPATVIAWVVTVGVGFTLNRRFTFGISGPERRIQHLGWFVVGALGQLAIGLAGYWLTLGQLHLRPTIAFLIVLVANTSFSFAFLNLVAFRRAG